MNWIDCDESHLEAIRVIFNDAITHSTALYEYEPRTQEFMARWWEGKRAGGFPVIGATDESGALLGFGTFGPFRSFPAYQHTVEHSVYVDRGFRGQGLGRQLLEQLIARAREQGLHTLIGVIDAANESSIALHRNLGFEDCGRIREVGWKFGRWLDVAIYQLVLPGSQEGRDVR